MVLSSRWLAFALRSLFLALLLALTGSPSHASKHYYFHVRRSISNKTRSSPFTTIFVCMPRFGDQVGLIHDTPAGRLAKFTGPYMRLYSP